ncbi:MAG: DNA polymerase I [Halobacteriovoraceae bacterium]|jgi:DNA polymerase I|nr:DNA polymerase I [Halobacteriovoraceae bacterium]MBT5095511.1 DNA polymerase I [Halobacteriovoraceae bacterium]
MSKRLIVIDVSNYIFRAFYAIRVLHSPDGTPVNAVHGVLGMFLKLFSEYRPTHVFLAKDTSGGTFRNDLYSEYKANRSAPPEDLIPQFDLIKQLTEKMGLVHTEHQNFEADDIIGSAVTQWKNDFDEIFIASGDKDLMQFVEGNVKVLDTMKDKIYDGEGVFEKMGVRPDQIVDYLSMVGDASDNIPGMKGIGAKGAAKLLAEHQTLEKCIEESGSFTGKKLTNAFGNHVEDALMSKKLVEIVTDIDLGHKFEDTAYTFYPSDELINWLKGLGFKSAITKLEGLRKGVHEAEMADEGQFTNLSSESVSLKIDKFLVGKDVSFSDLLKKIEGSSALSMYTEYSGMDIYDRELISATLSFDGKEIFHLVFGEQDGSLPEKEKNEFLSATWGNEDIEICSDHSKRDFRHALIKEIPFAAQNFDITQVHYILHTESRHSLENIVDEQMGHQLSVLSKKEMETFFEVMNTDEAISYAGERAAAIYLLAERFKSDLKEKKLDKIYYEMDDLLIPILASMEKIGINLNPGYLKELEFTLSKKLEKIEVEVKEQVEGEINLNSPKQVGKLLFEDLGLPVIKKTKTGFSTDSEVLEELTERGLSPIPALILQYRELGKILSTYVKALPLLVNSKTKRIHTHFNQHVAATGRLSSVNPNLQNIPIRSETGRLVRKAFMANPGQILLAADYSQVELRILAHMSGDETMVNAFNQGQDIHAQTASEIMGIAIEDVTSNERSKAKAVNFGLMYGQSSFGLAKTLKISRKDAKEYITRYFERFSGVKAFLDSLKEEAEAKGYCETSYGRKRFLPEIYSKNRTVKAMAERVAVNSPIQGTAADIIKLAMVRIDGQMKEKKLKSNMLLQVHDELIFEVPESELSSMKKLVREGMEGVVSFKVPLKVDMGIGVNWYDLK